MRPLMAAVVSGGLLCTAAPAAAEVWDKVLSVEDMWFGSMLLVGIILLLARGNGGWAMPSGRSGRSPAGGRYWNGMIPMSAPPSSANWGQRGAGMPMDRPRW